MKMYKHGLIFPYDSCHCEQRQPFRECPLFHSGRVNFDMAWANHMEPISDTTKRIRVLRWDLRQIDG